MSSTFRMKLNIPTQTQTQTQTQKQTQPQTQTQPNIFRQQTTNLVLSSTTKRVCVPLKVTGNKRCASCGHK